MKRRAIKLANNTIVVSLPSAWVRRTGVNKGDLLNMEESGNMLLIKPAGQDIQKRFKLDCQTQQFSKNTISYLYQKGYDEIEIVNINSELFGQIKERVSDLLGFEIIERAENSCIVKAVSKELEGEFDNLLRRTFLITLEMARNIYESLYSKDFSRITDIRDLEKTTNTFTDFCKRILSKGTYTDAENTIYMYIIVRDLEKIADSYRFICDAIIGHKGEFKISKKTISFVQRVNTFLGLLYKLFYRFEPAAFSQLKEEGKKINSIGAELYKAALPHEAYILSNMMIISTNIAELSGPHFIMNANLLKQDQ